MADVAEGAGAGRAKAVCAQCKRKLPLAAASMPCKCGGLFCGAHRQAEEHACSFDYRAAEASKLSTAMVRVQAAKVAVL